MSDAVTLYFIFDHLGKDQCLIHQVNSSARIQWAENIGEGGVIREWLYAEYASPLIEAVHFNGFPNIVEKAFMPDRHSLRHLGRARSVYDVSNFATRN